MSNEDQSKLLKFFPGNEIFGVLDSMKTGQNSPLRITVLDKSFNLPLLKIIESMGNVLNITLKKVKENNSFILWDIELNEKTSNTLECPHCKKAFPVDEELKYSLKTYIIESLNSNLLVLVSSFNKEDYDLLINNLNSLYPLISRVFYRESDLRIILENIRDIKKLEVLGKECVVKRLFEEKKTVVTYEEDTIERFFSKAKSENGWIDSIEVVISSIGVLRFSRRGMILYSKPFNFRYFFEIIVQTIIEEILIKRRASFQVKARSIENIKSTPLRIVLDKDYFKEKENILKLVELLMKNKDYEVALIYFADGLAHLDLYDYANGGGFDIYINSLNELLIVPQTQANHLAVEALIIRINDLYEGIIR